jgi:membrane protein DedA with SNARE-associated domain
MDSTWLQAILDWVQVHPQATGWLIFVVALGESLLLVGILLPGAAILVALGTLIGLGVLDLKVAWISATLGAFAGDGISFWIGHYYKKKLLKMWPIYKFPTLIDHGQTFFTKWGTLSVFVGRFVGLVRPIIPAIAGMMQMPIKKYLTISTVAAILWAPFYLLPGMLFGNAMGSMTKVAGKLAILLVIFILAVVFFYWIIQLIYGFLLPRTHRILSKALIWSQEHPTLGRITSGLIDPRKPEKGSLAFMATFIIALTIISLLVILNSQTINAWSMQVNQFMLAFHTDWTEPVMLFFLALSHDLSIIIPSILVLFWFIRRKRKVAALHWVFVVIVGYILSMFIQYFSADDDKNWFGFHHLAWFVSVISFWSALISGALPHKLRSWPYTLATILIAVVAFTQLFFEQMSLGVTLISIFSAIFLSSVIAIAFRMRVRKQLLGWPVTIILFSSQAIMIIIVIIMFYHQVCQVKTINLIELTTENWQSKPIAERQDWLNRSKQLFHINFHGNLTSLSHHLQQQGYHSTQPKAWADVWQALRQDENSKNIAIIPTTNDGKIETIIYYKIVGENMQALHLWKQPLKLTSSNAGVYLGYVSRHKIAWNWGLTFWKSYDDNAVLDEFMQSIKQIESIKVKLVDQQIFLDTTP